MRGKVIVRDGEEIGHALARLRREVCKDRASDKWPVWAGHHAKPSEVSHRKAWVREMKRKWRRVREDTHRKQLAKHDPTTRP